MHKKNRIYDYKVEDKYKQKEIVRKGHYILYSLVFSSPLQTPFPENTTVYGRYYKPIMSNRAILAVQVNCFKYLHE